MTNRGFQIFFPAYLPPTEYKKHLLSSTSIETYLAPATWRIMVIDDDGAWVCNNLPNGLSDDEKIIVAARYADTLNQWWSASGGATMPVPAAVVRTARVLVAPPSPFDFDYRTGFPPICAEYAAIKAASR